jgi:hypothetical protein
MGLTRQISSKNLQKIFLGAENGADACNIDWVHSIKCVMYSKHINGIGFNISE